MEAIRAKLKKKMPGAISLKTKLVIASEYYTKKEMKQKFKTPKFRHSKKRKSRKKILALLEQQSTQNNDHGSRSDLIKRKNLQTKNDFA